MEIVVQVFYPVDRCMVIGEVQAVRVRGGMVFEMRDVVPRDGYSGSISSCGISRSTERKSSQSQWKEWYHSRELIFERKKEKKGGRRSSSRRSVLVAESKTKLSIHHRS